jgi:hypothetical protein
MTTPDDPRSLPVVDMSPGAIERRLVQVGALYPLMLSLRAATVQPTGDPDTGQPTMGPTRSR